MYEVFLKTTIALRWSPDLATTITNIKQKSLHLKKEMQDGYENIIFNIMLRDRETIAEHIEVGYRLRILG